jgi:hypothetical protein
MLRKPECWSGVKRALSHLFPDAVVKPDCQRFQGLKVLSPFPSGHFIFDGVRQTLVESSNHIRIPPTLGKVSHWSGPSEEVEQSAGRFSFANWVVEDSSQRLLSICKMVAAVAIPPLPTPGHCPRVEMM